MIVICNDICKRLFSMDYKTIDDDERKKLDELAEHVLKDNDWNNVYSFFDSYLRNECKTENDVINYVLWFIRYVGLSFTIPSSFDAYDLIGYIYSKVDLEKRWNDCGGEFDDFANEALKIDLVKDPYYQFWRDPKIIEIANKYKEVK